MYASVGREVCRGMQGSRGPWGLVGGYLGRGGKGLCRMQVMTLEQGRKRVGVWYVSGLH